MNKKNKILLMGTIVLLLIINVVTAYLYYAKKVVKVVYVKEDENIQDINNINNNIPIDTVSNEQFNQNINCRLEEKKDYTEGDIVVDWYQEEEKVSYTEIFSDEMLNEYRNCGSTITNYEDSEVTKEGKIISGPYIGGELYFAIVEYEGIGMETNEYRIVIFEDKKILLGNYNNNSNDDGKLFILNNNIKISNLGMPDKIKSPNSNLVFSLYSYSEEEKWDENEKFKKVFEFEKGNFLYKGEDNCYYVKTEDGMKAGYYMDNSILANEYGDGNALLDVVWSNGESNNDDYGHTEITGGCGRTSGCYNYDYSLTKNDLKVAGVLKNGDPIYELKSYNEDISKELKTLYSNIYSGYQEEKESYEDFLKDHPIVFWQDPFGGFIKLKKTKYLPAAECGKPVIYLYPEKTQDISVWVNPNGGFTITEPAYNDGWKVKSDPESNIYNYNDGQVYPYLFWEGHAYNYAMENEGFVVARENVEKFLIDSLTKLGLVKKEYDEFIEFWLPKMQDKNYYFISFLPQEKFEKIAPLTVVPKPDTVIRVFMDYKELDNKIKVKPQKLSAPERRGFTVVEWGGALHK